MSKLSDYPFEIRPLTSDEGGGYLISYPDFAECISDGATVDEALAHGKLALKETIAALKSKDLPVPLPRSGGVASGKFIARVPKTVHAQLATRLTVVHDDYCKIAQSVFDVEYASIIGPKRLALPSRF